MTDCYRKSYIRKIGIMLPADWEVHHLDRNRKNNSFLNLVAIPIELHQKFHGLLAKKRANKSDVDIYKTEFLTVWHKIEYYMLIRDKLANITEKDYEKYRQRLIKKGELPPFQ